MNKFGTTAETMHCFGSVHKNGDLVTDEINFPLFGRDPAAYGALRTYIARCRALEYPDGYIARLEKIGDSFFDSYRVLGPLKPDERSMQADEFMPDYEEIEKLDEYIKALADGAGRSEPQKISDKDRADGLETWVKELKRKHEEGVLIDRDFDLAILNSRKYMSPDPVEKVSENK